MKLIKKVELNSSLDNFLNIAKEKQKKSSIGYKNRDIDAIEEGEEMEMETYTVKEVQILNY